MYGPSQQKYLDSVGGAGHQSAVELLGKLDELCNATNDLMKQIGACGDIDAKHVDRVMNALHDIDGGQPFNEPLGDISGLVQLSAPSNL